MGILTHILAYYYIRFFKRSASVIKFVLIIENLFLVYSHPFGQDGWDIIFSEQIREIISQYYLYYLFYF